MPKKSIKIPSAGNNINVVLSNLTSAIIDGNEEHATGFLKQKITIQALKREIEKDGGSELLCLAVEQGCGKVVEALLNKGADVNGRNKLDQSALDVAVEIPSNFGEMDINTQTARLNIIQLLVKSNANPDVPDLDGNTPRSIVERDGQQDIIDILNPPSRTKTLAKKTPDKPAVTATNQQKALAALATLSLRQASPQASPILLHTAAVNGNLLQTKILLRNGANIESTDQNGFPPLHSAVIGGQAKVALMLLKKGANASAQNRFNQTPLHLAASYNHLIIATELLKRGVNREAQDKQGYTPLHVAANHDSKDVAAILVENGADIASRSYLGGTPLFMAVSGDHVSMTTWLLENGADVNAQDKHNNTPLHIAAAQGHRGVYNTLLNHNAASEAVNNDGFTAIMLAARKQIQQGGLFYSGV